MGIRWIIGGRPEKGPKDLPLEAQGETLFRYLSDHLPATESLCESSREFEFRSLGDCGTVFHCSESSSGLEFVCKFFSLRDLPEQDCCDLMNFELRCLEDLRRCGFDRPPFQVVRPLAAETGLGCVLVEEFVHGKDLDHFVSKATGQGKDRPLLEKLEILAGFLARLHQTTSRAASCHFALPCRLFRLFVKGLDPVEAISGEVLLPLCHLCDKWEASRCMWIESTSLIHGDATPTNFIFQGGGSVTAIDLERLRRGDPVQDLGLVAAELKHHFALRLLHAEGAEPFISHFFRSYAQAFPEPESTFAQITRRNPFYMALGEVRIARNAWLPEGHRRWLLEEAVRCLRL